MDAVEMDAIEINATEQQRQQLLEEIRAFPANALQEAVDFITQLHRKTAESETKQSSEQTTSSPYEAFKKSGFIGCGEGPSDLAANHKKYLEEGWQDKYGHR